MGMEVLGADSTPKQVKEGIEGESTFMHEENKNIKIVQSQRPGESMKFGLMDGSKGGNGETKEVDHAANANFPKDAVDEWPALKQVHSFYFVKYRSYDDPKLKAKIEQAEKDIQKKNQARFQITEALKGKRSERSRVISELKPLTAENKQYRMIIDEKRKEMEPLQTALGKLRNPNNSAREKGVGLCSSEEELNDLIQSLHYRIQHESNTLAEEKQLLKEIKQLEGTRGKVVANDSMRAKIQDSLGQREDIQDRVKLIGVDLDGVRKEQQIVRTKIKHLEEELTAIDEEIESLQKELASVTDKRDKAYETLNELRKLRDETNACYFQNRSLLNNARDLAAKKDTTALEGLAKNEVEKFMLRWSSDKAFRSDYERRILSSLDNRQLSRDGRMRNPDEKPIILESSVPTESETVSSKVGIKRSKEETDLPSHRDNDSLHKVQKKDSVKSSEVYLRGKVGSPEDVEASLEIENPQKDSLKVKEIDAAKLKETRREEEIAKAKLAFERKKKLAEKAAAKASARAQKEAEKKFKEKEKRAKKKAGAVLPPAADQTESDKQVEELEEYIKEAPASENTREHIEKVVRYRNRPKAQDQIPKIVLKRKKSDSYWLWVAPAIIFVLVLLISGYLYALGRI